MEKYAAPLISGGRSSVCLLGTFIHCPSASSSLIDTRVSAQGKLDLCYGSTWAASWFRGSEGEPITWCRGLSV